MVLHKIGKLMKHTKKIIFMLSLSSISLAATPIDGLYYGAFGGAALQPGNVDVYYQDKLINNSNYNTGYDVGGSLGYKAGFWRYEAEVTYFNTPIKSLTVDNYVDDYSQGYNQGTLAFVNLYLDLPYKPVRLIQPFIGAGIGWSWMHASFLNHNNFKFDSTNYAFAGQGIVGLSYYFAENYSLFFAYRYVATTKMNGLGNSFQANLLNGGAIYRFDGCEYK
jgi:opacity protein-like surface antigen